MVSVARAGLDALPAVSVAVIVARQVPRASPAVDTAIELAPVTPVRFSVLAVG